MNDVRLILNVIIADLKTDADHWYAQAVTCRQRHDAVGERESRLRAIVLEAKARSYAESVQRHQAVDPFFADVTLMERAS